MPSAAPGFLELFWYWQWEEGATFPVEYADYLA